ncbi:MAG: hypothetical protein RL198_389 [Actinomycetota bacterium]
MFNSKDNLIAGSYYQNNYSQKENQRFAVQFDSITKEMVSLLDQGLAADSDQMQQAVRKHFEFCLQFWTPNRESYKSLALSYILPGPYKDTYDDYRQGLGQYIYEAVVEFADRELS